MDKRNIEARLVNLNQGRSMVENNARKDLQVHNTQVHNARKDFIYVCKIQVPCQVHECHFVILGCFRKPMVYIWS